MTIWYPPPKLRVDRIVAEAQRRGVTLDDLGATVGYCGYTIEAIACGRQAAPRNFEADMTRALALCDERNEYIIDLDTSPYDDMGTWRYDMIERAVFRQSEKAPPNEAC